MNNVFPSVDILAPNTGALVFRLERKACHVLSSRFAYCIELWVMVRKRPASAAAPGEKRLKESALCKHPSCTTGKNSTRGRKQTGCMGYCVQCVSAFEPEAAEARLRKNKEKTFFCSRCSSTPAQNGYEGFCKACWPDRAEDILVHSCFYCQGILVEDKLIGLSDLPDCWIIPLVGIRGRHVIRTATPL